MLDPVSALGLLGTLLQMVDFSDKVINQAREIRKNGSTEEQRLWRNNGESLLRLSEQMAVKLRRLEEQEGALSEEDKAFEEVCRQAQVIAKDLLANLGKHDVSSSTGSIATWRAGFKAVISSNKQNDMKLELTRVQDLLQSHSEFATQRLIEKQNNRQDAQFEQLFNKIQDAVTTFLGYYGRVRNDNNADNATTFDQQSDNIAAIREDIANLEMIVKSRGIPLQHSIKTMNIETDLSEIQEQRAQDVLLDSLSFWISSDRRDNISAAHEKTFRWVLRDDSSQHVKWSNFAVWLREGSGIYWVAGKPASGKSTLMKYLLGNARTYEIANTWARENTLIFADFYFWSTGVAEQRSQNGFLRALLFAVLSKCRSTLPEAFPDHYQKLLQSIRAGKALPRITWTDATLQDAIYRTARALPKNLRLCIFVDGLDEYEGDANELLKLLTGIQNPQIKMIVSSRIEPIYKEAFEGYPQLWIHELTREDIKEYVTASFQPYLADHCHHQRNLFQAEDISRLTNYIVDKASGVFLWVVLVVRSLINGLRDGNTINELTRLLSEIPSDLNKFYKHMMTRMRTSYQVQASKYLQLVLRSTEVQYQYQMMPPQFWYCCQLDEEAANDCRVQPYITTVGGEHPEVEARLGSRCCGFVEIHREDKWISFIHKSVADFLRQPEIWKQMMDLTPTSSFDPNLLLARSCLLLLENSILPTAINRDPRWTTQYYTYFLLYLKDLEDKSCQTRVDLLRKFRKLMQTQKSVQFETDDLGGSVPQILPLELVRPLHDTPVDLAIAICAGLRLHFQKLYSELGPKLRRTEAASILSLAVSARTTKIALHYQFLDDLESLVKDLLQSSIDPNLPNLDSRSAWVHAVTAMCSFSGATSKGSHEILSYYLRIASHFVDHGAWADGKDLYKLSGAVRPFGTASSQPAASLCIAALNLGKYYCQTKEEHCVGRRLFEEERGALVERLDAVGRSQRRKKRAGLPRWLNSRSSLTPFKALVDIT